MNSSEPVNLAECSRKPIDRVEAQKILDAFVNGYIDQENHPDVLEAARVLGKHVVVKKIRGISTPSSFLTLRTTH